MDLPSDVLALGGIAATYELLARSHSPHQLHAAWRSGELIRPRKGWYTHPSVGADVIEAVRVGGRLACVSAAVLHGLWVPEHEGLHVEVVESASRLRTRQDHRVRLAAAPVTDVVVHWVSHGMQDDRRATDVGSAVVQIHRCLDARAGFVVLESALRLQRLDTIERFAVIDSLPMYLRAVAAEAGCLSDSGTESFMKLGLLDLGIRFRQQVRIDGVGPVDFLIGDRLVVEVDSRSHHSDPYRDRRRDAELSARGYRVLRFMYSQIIHEWPRVEAAIMAAVIRGDHFVG